ncbi:MAG: hypothetical protein LBG58_01135 [Planctomycetaceae bacterium]|jgi:hypothetical protein|nr:hypothetical protein [Planctomycetaceae bacterium]
MAGGATAGFINGYSIGLFETGSHHDALLQGFEEAKFGAGIGGVLGGVLSPGFYLVGKGIEKTVTTLSANKLSNSNSTHELREYVLNNIRESQTARESSNFGVHIVKEAQIKGGYHADQWAMTKIPKGSTIYGGRPGQSNYYTGLSTIEQNAYNKVGLWESLQVPPNPSLGYRPQVAVYQVNEDIIVASGNALANPQYGSGGGIQFFVRDYQKSLTLLDIIDLH